MKCAFCVLAVISLSGCQFSGPMSGINCRESPAPCLAAALAGTVIVGLALRNQRGGGGSDGGGSTCGDLC